KSNHVKSSASNDPTPAIMLDDSCIREKDLSCAATGKIKDINALPNLYAILNNEASKETPIKHVGVLSWFSELGNANNSFVIDVRLLQGSYEIFKDDNARNAFDYSLIIREQKLHREMTHKKMSDVEEEEERMHRKIMDDLYDENERKQKERARLLKEVNRMRGIQANKMNYTFYDYVNIRLKQQQKNIGGKSSTCEGLDKEKMLRVYWAKVGLDCNEKTLRKIFKTFGEVEDVVIIKSSTKKGSALVVMATKEGADIAVTGTLC
nr:DnaJ homolog subfamily C member 17 [Tanacetum cinerariifolium]